MLKRKRGLKLYLLREVCVIVANDLLKVGKQKIWNVSFCMKCLIVVVVC